MESKEQLLGVVNKPNDNDETEHLVNWLVDYIDILKKNGAYEIGFVPYALQPATFKKLCEKAEKYLEKQSDTEEQNISDFFVPNDILEDNTKELETSREDVSSASLDGKDIFLELYDKISELQRYKVTTTWESDSPEQSNVFTLPKMVFMQIIKKITDINEEARKKLNAELENIINKLDNSQLLALMELVKNKIAETEEKSVSEAFLGSTDSNTNADTVDSIDNDVVPADTKSDDFFQPFGSNFDNLTFEVPSPNDDINKEKLVYPSLVKTNDGDNDFISDVTPIINIKDDTDNMLTPNTSNNAINFNKFDFNSSKDVGSHDINSVSPSKNANPSDFSDYISEGAVPVSSPIRR